MNNAALLVTGGDIPNFSFLKHHLTSISFICAADSGLEAVHRWGIAPSLIVGDMDSLSNRSLLDDYAEVETIVVPAEKDETDTELGLRILWERGYRHITLAGGGGGRLDHLLAIRALFERVMRPREWFTASERIVLVDEPEDFTTQAGSVVSVFPLAGGAEGMRSYGLKWPLDGLRWGVGDFGVSNVAEVGRFRVDPGSGALLVVLPLDAENWHLGRVCR